MIKSSVIPWLWPEFELEEDPFPELEVEPEAGPEVEPGFKPEVEPLDDPVNELVVELYEGL